MNNNTLLLPCIKNQTIGNNTLTQLIANAASACNVTALDVKVAVRETLEADHHQVSGFVNAYHDAAFGTDTCANGTYMAQIQGGTLLASSLSESISLAETYGICRVNNVCTKFENDSSKATTIVSNIVNGCKDIVILDNFFATATALQQKVNCLESKECGHNTIIREYVKSEYDNYVNSSALMSDLCESKSSVYADCSEFARANESLVKAHLSLIEHFDMFEASL